MFSIVNELNRQSKELVAIIRKKDREIQDYKDHGATISRREGETDVVALFCLEHDGASLGFKAYLKPHKDSVRLYMYIEHIIYALVCIVPHLLTGKLSRDA